RALLVAPGRDAGALERADPLGRVAGQLDRGLPGALLVGDGDRVGEERGERRHDDADHHDRDEHLDEREPAVAVVHDDGEGDAEAEADGDGVGAAAATNASMVSASVTPSFATVTTVLLMS